MVASPTRTMVVDRSPTEIVERICSQPQVRLRRLEEELLPSPYCVGLLFVEVHPDHIMLWRRPKPPRMRGGHAEYSDVAVLRLLPKARGTQIEIRLQPHPHAIDPARADLGFIVLNVVGSLVIGVCTGAWQLGLIVFSFVPLSLLLSWRFQASPRNRHVRHTMLTSIFAWLAPHELGPADEEGSVFRVGRAATFRPRSLPSRTTPDVDR